MTASDSCCRGGAPPPRQTGGNLLHGDWRLSGHDEVPVPHMASGRLIRQEALAGLGAAGIVSRGGAAVKANQRADRRVFRSPVLFH